MDGESFFRKEIPPRRTVSGSWFREGSLGFIFGRRGAGKTWFAWDMAICVSRGVAYGPWKCERPRKTLYVDGEMPLKSMQERLKLLNIGRTRRSKGTFCMDSTPLPVCKSEDLKISSMKCFPVSAPHNPLILPFMRLLLPLTWALYFEIRVN
ncbi:MAG: AAA family ATPase [Puniceicoccales bacterium]|jgi:hypothetical protein|nr:AAA family ATPase [Puniceicoccales bacterium]